MDPKRLEAVERILQQHHEFQPTLENQTAKTVLKAVEQNLAQHSTSFPAEAVARNLMYGGIFGYAGVVILQKGGLKYAGPEYGEWLNGLLIPAMLMDQAFAVLSKGPSWVCDSMNRAMSSKDFNIDGPPGRWGYDLVKQNVIAASKQLRADSSGMRMLAWLLEEQAQRCDLHCLVGMVAYARLHSAFLSELTANGYHSVGILFGPDGAVF